MRAKLSIWTASAVAVAAVFAVSLSATSGGRVPVEVAAASETVIVPPRPVSTGETKTGPDWQPVYVGNLELWVAPFPDLVKGSAAVVRGRVTDVSSPVLNLAPGESYDPHREYPQALTYHTATVTVEHWMMSDGTISGDDVEVTVPGGCYEDVIGQEEIDALMLPADAVTAGSSICRGDRVYGGLDFRPGDRVALLLGNSMMAYGDGERAAVMVTAHGIGVLHERPDGSLHQPAVDTPMPSAPRNVGELQAMVHAAGRGRP